MSTRVPRYMTISVAMVLFAGIFVRIVSGQPQDEGVRYKTKHLKEHRGTLIKNPSQDKKVEEDVIQIGSESETQLQTNTDQENFALQPYMTAIKPVSVNRYRLAMSKAQTHYDVFRMFIPEELSEEIVDNIMMTMTTLPIGLTVGRTSIGDHDTVRITPGIHHTPHKQTTALVPHNKHTFHFSYGGSDVMMADSPVCANCHRIRGSSIGTYRSGHVKLRERRLQTESWRRRKRRHKPRRDKHKAMRKCKKRRKTIAMHIKKCTKDNNRERCRTLRDRYKKLRQKCKRNSQNQSIIPGESVGLPDPLKVANTEPPPDVGAPSNQQEQWSQWEETLKETRSSECGRPVPEVIRVCNVLGGGDEEYTPSCVLSYRCRRDSGCCLHEFQECTAIKSEQTLKTVLVAKSDSADNQIHFENVMVREFNVTNDTECGCTTIVTPTHIPCPHPFEYDINIQRCRCRDASFKQTCRKIQKGDGMLTPSTIKCIQQGRCRPLDNCYYGDYDMSLNQCPKDQSGSGIEPPNVRKQQRRPHRG